MAYDDSALLATINKKPSTNPTLDALRAKIQTSVDSDQAGNNFRFDPNYAERLRQLQGQFAGYDSQEELGNRRIGEDYLTAKRNASDTNTDTLKRLQEKLANSGIGRSGINIAAQGDIEGAYQKDLGALGTSTTRSLEDLQRGLASGRQGLVDEKSSLDTARTRSESDYRVEEERKKAEAEATSNALAQQKAQFEELKTKILESQQPQPTPTGQLQLPSIPQPAAPGQPPPVAPPAPPNPDQLAIQQARQNFQSPAQIKLLQQSLMRQGFNPGPIDGSWGPKTIAAYLASLKVPSGGSSTNLLGGNTTRTAKQSIL